MGDMYGKCESRECCQECPTCKYAWPCTDGETRHSAECIEQKTIIWGLVTAYLSVVLNSHTASGIVPSFSLQTLCCCVGNMHDHHVCVCTGCIVLRLHRLNKSQFPGPVCYYVNCECVLPPTCLFYSICGNTITQSGGATIPKRLKAAVLTCSHNS